jgi:Xaa-Pro aminopeptidase
MILSDEPGYYEDGKFGIRIENIVKIVPANTKHNFQGTASRILLLISSTS